MGQGNYNTVLTPWHFLLARNGRQDCQVLCCYEGPLMLWTATYPKQQTSGGADGKALHFSYLLSASHLWLATKATVLVWNTATIVISKAIIPADNFQAHELLKSLNGFQRVLNTILDRRSVVVWTGLLAQKVFAKYKLWEMRSIWPGMDHSIHPACYSYISILYQWQMKQEHSVLHPDWHHGSYASRNTPSMNRAG